MVVGVLGSVCGLRTDVTREDAGRTDGICFAEFDQHYELANHVAAHGAPSSRRGK